MECDQRVGNDASADEVFLDDSFEDGRIARAVPRALWIDDRDRPALTDPEAVGFGSESAALLRQAELFEPALEKLPRLQTALLLAAFGRRLIAAEKDVSSRD